MKAIGVYVKTIVLVVLAISCLIAHIFVGCDTLSVNSDESEQPKIKITNMYYVPLKSAEYRKAQLMQLETVKSWQGSEKKEIKYNAQKSPWVLNASHKVISELGSRFDVVISKEVSPGLKVEVGRGGSFGDVESYIVEGAGEYIILIAASGCEWWTKVGVE